MQTALTIVLVSSLVATAPRAQAVNLQVQSAFGISGTLCGPWACQPDPLLAPQGGTLQLLMGAVTGSTMFLLVALPPTQCTPIPGLGGSLIVQPPASVMVLSPQSWQTTYVYPSPPGPCAFRQGLELLVLPPALPSGLQIVLQTLAVDWQINPFPWSFSNAVLVTVQ